MTEAALVLVCKRPASGIGKQRLAASIGGEAANHIAEALLAARWKTQLLGPVRW